MATDAVGRTGEQTESAVGKPAGDAVEQATTSISDELRSVGRQAAAEVLKAVTPVAKDAAEHVMKEVATRGPAMALHLMGGVGGLAKKSLGGAAGAAGGLISKMLPGGKGGKRGAPPSGTGRGRRLPIQAWVDVGVPLENAYAQWTQFKEFPKYMFRTERLEQKDDTHLEWHSKIWGIRRSWEAEITQQRPKHRIVWKATSGANHVGVITFHPLAHNLTRVQVNLDFQPTGLLEKTGSGLRATRRAVQSDLMRFKALIEMREEPEGEWQGAIEDGEVVQEEGPPEEGEAEQGPPEEGEAEQRQAEDGQAEQDASSGQKQEQESADDKQAPAQEPAAPAQQPQEAESTAHGGNGEQPQSRE